MRYSSVRAWFNRIAVAVAFVTMVFCFQNCAAGFDVDEYYKSANFESLNVNCGTNLEEAFSATYWPVVRASCTGCHSSGGSAPSYFASTTLSAAYLGFRTATQAKILTNGTNPIHGGGAGGEKNRGAITQAQDAFNACKISQVPLPGAITARTTGVVVAATATAKIVTINLDSQLELGSSNFGGAQFQFQVRTATVGAAPVYIISNPSLRTVSSTVQLKGFKLKINGVTDDAWTGFSRIDRVINAGAQPMTGTTLNGNLAVGNGTFAVTTIQASDSFQFEFETLTVP